MILLPGRIPCWDGFRSSQVGQVDEGGAGYVSVLLRQNNEPDVAVLTSAKVALNRRRVCHQYLMNLFDCRAIGLVLLLGG